MKYALVKNNLQITAPVGFDQWARAMDAKALTVGELEETCKAEAYDVVHCLLEETGMQQLVRTVSFLSSVSPKTFLILSVEAPLQRKQAEKYRQVFRCFDLILCSNDDLYRLCRANAPAECMVRTEVSPVDADHYRSFVRPAEERRLFTIIAADYSWRKLIADFGWKFASILFLRFKVRFVAPSVQDKKLAKLIGMSRYVMVPRPAYDGGKVVTLCAMSKTLLVAHPSLEGARNIFPYTIFDPGRPALIRYLFQWLFSASGFEPSFLDNAAHSLENLNHRNKAAQLLNLIGYRKKISPEEPKASEGSRMNDQLCLASEIKHVKGEESIKYERNEFVVVCLLKDGEEHLPSFLNHYRKLGARRFIFIDNGSTDNTLTILFQQPDVTLYTTRLPHKYFEIEIRRIMIEKHCRNHWCLWVDIDELFDYPFSDKMGMRALLDYLNRHKFNAMVAHMLDMYNSDPVERAKGEPLRLTEDYPCYDVSGIIRKPYFDQTNIAYNRNNTLSNPEICCFWGGIRKQIFSDIEHDNILTKHPLLFLDGELEPVTNAHFSDKARVADITGVLYHYKFVPSFVEKVRKSYAERNYVKFAQNEYDAYYRYLQDNGSFTMHTSTTRKLEHVNELVEEGFLAISPEWLQSLKGREEKHPGISQLV